MLCNAGWEQFIPQRTTMATLYNVLFQDADTYINHLKEHIVSLQAINSDYFSQNEYIRICKEAVAIDGLALQYVKDISNINDYKEICKIAIKQNAKAIKYINRDLLADDIYDLYILALAVNKQNGCSTDVIKYLKDIRLLTTFKNLSVEAVKQNATALRHIIYLDVDVPFVLDNHKILVKNLEEICLAAVQHNGLAMQFITTINLPYCRTARILKILAKNTIPINIYDEEICLCAVQQNGLSLQFMRDQNEKICTAAVKNNNKAFKYVYKQFRTPQLLFEVIQNYTKAIKYIKQNIDICEKALEIDPLTLKYVNIVNENLYLKAVKKNGLALQYIKFENQNENIVKKAFKQNKLAIKYMDPKFFEIYL